MIPLPRCLSFIKSFRGQIGADFAFDLMDVDEIDNIPETPGVYVIVSSDGTSFQYPNGKSPIMYIGMSTNLRDRIYQHHKNTKYIAENLCDFREKNRQCHQRYHYFRAFGARVYVFSRRGQQLPKEQEALFIGCFYEKYLSLPVSNGARSFSCK